MQMSNTHKGDSMRVYVGTYGKYAGGSIAGEWVDVTDFSSKDEFLERCAEIHDDEHDPEFMFQDWEEIPDTYISESSIDEGLWEYIETLEDMSDDEAEAFRDFLDNGSGETVDEFRDAYMGQFRSMREYAEHCVDEGLMGEIPDHLSHYIDYDAIARDFQYGGDYWISNNGHVFRNL